MKTRSWQRIAVGLPFGFLFMILIIVSGTAQASKLWAPTPPPPIQGCNSATGVGANYKTCAFYVVASSVAQTSNDAGMKPECFYTISDPEIYFGRCNTGSTPISSGFRFQSVSIPIPTGQSLLASYIEFMVDGTYTNKIVTNIFGQVPNPTPRAFSGTSASDVTTNRAVVQPTKQWAIESAARIYNMGDPWVLTETRRTPDVTPILTAIKGSNWQANSNVVFLFKSDYANSTAARRVLAFERAGSKPARLVTRIGEIPKASVSYYWQSVTCTTTTPIVCTPNNTILGNKARIEAQRSKQVVVILNFGKPTASQNRMGTFLVNQPTKYVPISKIEAAIKRYITVFMNNDLANSKLWLGVGTNNTGDLMCVNQGYGTSHGNQWALMINRLNTWVGQQGYNNAPNPPDKVKVAGAVDFEKWTGKDPNNTILVCNGQTLPEAPPSEALNWATAYSGATNHSYIYFGDYADAAEGLGLTRWGADLTWELSWGIPEAYPLPEIYTPTGTLSAKWQTLARYSAICNGSPQCRPAIRATDPNWVAIKGRTMQFLGSLTNFGEQNCDNSDTNSPNQGWLQLYRHLVVDLYTDNNFPIYSSDITYEDATHQTADTCPIP